MKEEKRKGAGRKTFTLEEIIKEELKEVREAKMIWNGIERRRGKCHICGDEPDKILYCSAYHPNYIAHMKQKSLEQLAEFMLKLPNARYKDEEPAHVFLERQIREHAEKIHKFMNGEK